jgi:hypothetical protein
MFVLYGFAALFFGLSFLYFKQLKRKIANFFLSLALFLNPLGYDLVVYWINNMTNDYWMTMSIMYVLAGTFFLGFMYLYNINPVKVLTYQAKQTHNHIKTKISKNG